ncbi:hypothetical protein ACFLW6_03975 [Chloroflexota bacterium]
MKELTYSKKRQVIKLFLDGLTYDEIGQRVSVAKGTVVNIIDEFREGSLPIPPGMVEYTDELRKLVIDLKKNSTGVAEVKSCLMLHARLKELGATGEKAEQWLGTCHDLATSTVSANQLIKAALELAELSSGTGLTYEEVNNTYQYKAQHVKELDTEVQNAENRLKEMKLEYKKKKGELTGELDSITKAMATAQEVFEKQKNDLKSRLDDYLASNQFAWEKVNIVVALLDGNLENSGLEKGEIDELSRRIRKTGSLANAIRGLVKEKGKLQDEVSELRKQGKMYTDRVIELMGTEHSLERSISENTQKSGQLSAEVKSKKVEMTELEKKTNQYTKNLYISRLILNFLFSPGDVSDYELDHLVSLMIALRQNRLGIEPRQVRDDRGTLLCACEVPRMSSIIRLSEAEIDNVRITFAQLLAPTVKDKFISRLDYELERLKHKLDILEAVTEERNRHIL